MAMLQTLALTKNLHWTPNTPLTNTNIPSLSLDPQSLLRFRSCPSEPTNNKRLRLSGRVKCWMDHNNNSNNGHYESLVGPPYPKPAEIQWKKELCNSVQLIGIVGTAVQLKQLNSGKVLAWSRLAVKTSASDTVWINLTFWDELAHVAFQHVEKGNQVYVSGRLVSDTVESDDGKQQIYYKVVVQQLNFIERNFSPVALYDGDSNSMTPGRKLKNNSANNTGSTVELWQAFFANPVDWWDNRKNKRSPNYPDFKHKDTGEALWVEGRNNPPWVKSQLSILDTKMESFHNHNVSMRTDFMVGNDFTRF